jgi:hypothetical protein
MEKIPALRQFTRALRRRQSELFAVFEDLKELNALSDFEIIMRRPPRYRHRLPEMARIATHRLKSHGSPPKPLVAPHGMYSEAVGRGCYPKITPLLWMHSTVDYLQSGADSRFRGMTKMALSYLDFAP